jgi:thiol-disulfide isomerase/thioredoxin
VGILLATTGSGAAEKQLWAKSVLGHKAPELVVERWLGPKPDTGGKFLLIDFWATWCPPCRATIPELNAFARKFADRLVVIGVSDEPEATVRRFNEPHIEYFSTIDTKARMKGILEVKGIPHVILIDPDGIVRWEGYPLLAGDRLTEQVVADVLSRYGRK